MNWIKQGIIILIVMLITGAIWVRYFPGAGEIAANAGIPERLVGLVTRSSEVTGNKPGEGPGNRRGNRSAASLVVVATVGEASINNRLTAIGDGEARRSVIVVPYSSGVLEEVHMMPGQRVTAGSVLAVLDAEAEKIARDQAALTVDTALEKVGRYETLLESLAGTEVQLTDARNELTKAQLILREAQLEYDRRSIRAPIDGTIGFVPVERGDYITQTTEVATIDDRSVILLDFWVPERFASVINVGDPVKAVPASLPGREFSGEISAIASRVDRESRTLLIRAELNNEEDLLRPGMSFRVSMQFAGETYAAVDPLAIQWSSDGAFVWKSLNGKSEKIPVRIIQRNSDYVLVTGDITRGEDVVVEGIQNLRPGSELNIARRIELPVSSGT
ncbi:MAG: efflux RND transporter periplasmic adaptor subunit [Pseudomonadota bacterium]